jgi:hypothetical protein
VPAHCEGGAHVLAEVELLECHGVRLVLAEQRVHGSVDLCQAPLGREPRARGDHATVQRQQPPVAALDHAVAGAGEARVDAENDHGR